MENSVPSETIIRDYLLGRLDPNSELVERMDEQMLTDAEFSEGVGVIEDEIIEEYLEDTLSPADKRSVQEHFLRPLQRQRKLQIARSLSRHFTATSHGKSAPTDGSTRTRNLSFPQSWPNFRVYAEIGAAVLLFISLVSFIQMRREFQSEVRESGQKLIAEREHSTVLDRQLQAARELTEPATATLNLLQPGITRGNAGLPQLRIGSRTQSVHVEIALPSAVPGQYNVRLESAGNTVWTQSGVEAFTSSVGALLIFDVPIQPLTQGESRFVVSRGSGSEVSYPFETSKQ
jgi:hypothetical protein